MRLSLTLCALTLLLCSVFLDHTRASDSFVAARESAHGSNEGDRGTNIANAKLSARSDPDPCPPEEDNCHANATCYYDGFFSYFCVCEAPYTVHVDCDEEMGGEECPTPNDCDANADCVPDDSNPEGYFCVCRPGFSGNGTTCEGSDPCADNDCSEFADCYPEYPSGYFCTCRSGYVGDGSTCYEFGDPCAGNDCAENADCEADFNAPDNYTCSCQTGYRGDGRTCTDDGCLTSADCATGEVCVPGTHRKRVCVCDSGFVLKEGRCVRKLPFPRLGAAYDAGRFVAGQLVPCGATINVQCAQFYTAGATSTGHVVSDCDTGVWTRNLPDCTYGGVSTGCPGGCRNGATCSDDGCICRDGFYGSQCEKRMCALSCSGHGECVLTNEGGYLDQRCECDDGFIGADCSDTMPDPCATSPCGAGKCMPNPEDNGETHLCLCDEGRYGENCTESVAAECDLDCGTNGVCNANGTECVCKAGWKGARCNRAPRRNGAEGCDLDCGAGTCQLRVDAEGRTRQSCFCPPGWLGAFCEDAGPDVCNRRCENGGSCFVDIVDTPSGRETVQKCKCPVAFAGPHCELDSPGNCDKDCGNGVCRYANGKEWCICVGKYHKSNDTMEAPCDLPEDVCATDCGDNAEGCIRELVYGDIYEDWCICKPFVTGRECQILPPPCSLNCSGRGSCKLASVRSSSGAGRDIVPICECDAGYYGGECEQAVCDVECKNGHCGVGANGEFACQCRPQYTGEACDELIDLPCSVSCDVNSTCVTRMENGNAVSRCVCNDRGQGGESCEYYIAPNASCGDCAGRGECRFYVGGGDGDGEYRCLCDSGYTGAHCESRKECPLNCNNHGRCIEGFCVCMSGYTGDSCEMEVRKACPDGCEDCDYITGTCRCKAGFGGASCNVSEAVSLPCPKNCSGMGTCNATTGTCVCAPGRGGDDCGNNTCSGRSGNCAKCLENDGCVFCKSSRTCMVGTDVPATLGNTAECALDDVASSQALCPTEHERGNFSVEVKKSNLPGSGTPTLNIGYSFASVDYARLFDVCAFVREVYQDAGDAIVHETTCSTEKYIPPESSGQGRRRLLSAEGLVLFMLSVEDGAETGTFAVVAREESTTDSTTSSGTGVDGATADGATDEDNGEDVLPTEAIVGIAVGGACLLAMISAVAYTRFMRTTEPKASRTRSVDEESEDVSFEDSASN